MIQNKIITEKSQELVSAIDRLMSLYPNIHGLILLDLAQLIQAQTVLLAQGEVKINIRNNALDNINKLINLFNRLETENIVPGINLCVLKFHYQLIFEYLKSLVVDKEKEKERGIIESGQSYDKNTMPIIEPNHNALTERQKAILAIFSSSDQPLQLNDVMNKFPYFTDRTIRSDLSCLVTSGYLAQNGFGRGSFYSSRNKISDI